MIILHKNLSIGHPLIRLFGHDLKTNEDDIFDIRSDQYCFRKNKRVLTRFLTKLRVVQTQAISLMKSMSKRGGSDIPRL